ncbi:MAG: ABC transporter permease [Rhodobacteraceae bacterium]|nr:ABC transporter permease [Paracoccaceae bacterium]
MLHYETRSHGIWTAIRISDLIFHSIVRVVRKSSANAFVGLFNSIFQSVAFIVVFYLMFSILGMRGNAVRGDFLLYLMTGIFLFLTHVKTMGAVVGSEGPASPIMKHAPMTTFVSISASALATLYLQILSAFVILFVTHVAIRPIHIEDPGGVFLSFFLAWFSGLAIGLIFLAIKPFAPAVASMGSMIYSRANMIASGKMFLANNLPGYLLPYFAWNPLFHTIDQARGAAFINYNPHVTSIMYPVYFSIGLLVVGMMGEFFTRQYASASWDARR